MADNCCCGGLGGPCCPDGTIPGRVHISFFNGVDGGVCLNGVTAVMIYNDTGIGPPPPTPGSTWFHWLAQNVTGVGAGCVGNFDWWCNEFTKTTWTLRCPEFLILLDLATYTCTPLMFSYTHVTCKINGVDGFIDATIVP